MLMGHVLGIGTQSKISDTVVTPYAVDMVNEAIRPSTVKQRPGNTMSQVFAALHLQAPIAIFANSLCSKSSAHPPPRRREPMQLTRFGIVTQVCFQIFSVDHIAPP